MTPTVPVPITLEHGAVLPLGHGVPPWVFNEPGGDLGAAPPDRRGALVDAHIAFKDMSLLKRHLEMVMRCGHTEVHAMQSYYEII